MDLLKRIRLPALVATYLLIAAISILTAGPVPDTAGDTGVVTAVVSGISMAGRRAAASGMAGIGDAYDRYVDVVAVRAANEQMRGELDRLRDENARLLGVMQENARLRAMVGFAEANPQLELVPARVIAKAVSPLFRVLAVRISIRDPRVRPGLPVVAGAGVVGHVAEVVGGSAQVVLAIDPRSSIDVVVQHNRARGVLQGLGSDRSYEARLSYLLRRDEVDVGDLLVTSGMDGRFPSDIVAGRVSSIRYASHGLFQDVRVEPAVDFSRIEEVFVILSEE